MGRGIPHFDRRGLKTTSQPENKIYVFDDLPKKLKKTIKMLPPLKVPSNRF